VATRVGIMVATIPATVAMTTTVATVVTGASPVTLERILKALRTRKKWGRYRCSPSMFVNVGHVESEYCNQQNLKSKDARIVPTSFDEARQFYRASF